MSKQLQKLKGKRSIAKTVRTAVSFATVGEALGYVALYYFPYVGIPASVFVHGIAALITLTGTIIFSNKFKTTAGQSLNDCFADADLLFAQGSIDERQLMRIRDNCLDKYLKD
jgi:hypothetical protein